MYSRLFHLSSNPSTWSAIKTRREKCGNVRGVLHHNALFELERKIMKFIPEFASLARVTNGNINKNYFSPRTLTFIILNIRSDSFLSTFRVCSQYSESRREKTEKPTLMFSIKSFLSKWLFCMINLKPCVHKQKKVHKMGKVTLRKHIFVAWIYYFQQTSNEHRRKTKNLHDAAVREGD